MSHAEPQVYINGQYFAASQATVSVFDHGLLYGDGIFEGIRSYVGRVFKLDEHVDRLYQGAKAIWLEIPLTVEQMKRAVIETLERNGLHDAYVRLIVTRGKGDLGLDPRKCEAGPTIIIIADQVQLYPPEVYSQGLELITVATRRNLPAALNPAIKSLNYLNNILAKIEVVQANCWEGLMLAQDGNVAEATGDNVFIYRSGSLITPPLHVGILEGITRQTVIELSRQMGIPVKEELFSQFHVYTANECFLTGTAAEIAPVVKVDGRMVGDGRPGALTRRLMEAFCRLTRGESESRSGGGESAASAGTTRSTAQRV